MLSIIIPNYNGSILLQRYISSVLQVTDAAEVVVVDDASTDNSVEMLWQQFPDVRVLERMENGGFSKAVNDGICTTKGDFIVLLNSDVEVTPGFLDPILSMFEDESVFAVCPRILLPSIGNIDEGCKTGFWHHGMFYGNQLQGITEVTPILYATGCTAVYRRSMLEQLRGFDEAYTPFYREDADLGYRAWKRGWKSLYQPGSMVHHQHAASISKLNRSFVDRIKARNSLFFVWRNIDDECLLRQHRLWLPAVLLKRAFQGDSAFLLGWKSAFMHRKEAVASRNLDSQHRVLSDREIFKTLRMLIPK